MVKSLKTVRDGLCPVRGRDEARPSLSRIVRFTVVVAALCAAMAPSPVQAETHALQPYAYVESHGTANAVDTGYYANKDTKFIADYEFVSIAAGAVFGANNNNNQIHGFYINGNGKMAYTVNGGWWWTTWDPGHDILDPVANQRTIATVLSTDNAASMVYYDSRKTYTSSITLSSGQSFNTLDSTMTTMLYQWWSSTGNATCAKMYSFEADDDCTSGVPALFFAPTVDADGNAGFTNVVDGTFHGEMNASASPALTYSNGIGNANDYKYEDSTLSAKFYAYAADTDMGAVKFGDDAASGATSAWIARGGSAALAAVPAAGYSFVGWTGDTWAITGGNASDATVTVASDRAAQLLANFTSGTVLSLAANANVVWGEAAWQTGGASASAPTSGDATIFLSGDATVSLDGDVSLDSVRILGGGTLTIARGAYSYSFASIETDSQAKLLESLSDGKIVIDRNASGAITELRMNPDPGETLMLDDGKLSFAAGAKIVPGQGGDAGGKSVIVGGFTAAGALKFDGAPQMTWTGSSFLDTTPEVLFSNARLDDIVPLYGYGKVGTSDYITYEGTYSYFAPYFIERDGDTVRFEMQQYDGSNHTKGFLMELTQSGDNIVGRWLIAGYFNKQNKLGTRMFKFENGTASRLSGVSSANYYHPKRLIVGPRSGDRSKLTFALSGAQTVPAVSGSGVEVTFDANGRGEPEEEFKSGNLARNNNWQTLTTEYSLSEIVLRSGYLQGTYCGQVPVIAFGWTNDNTTAGCQLQYLTADNSYMRGVDVVLRQGDGKVEIKRVKALYISKSHAKNGVDYTTIYGNRYLLESDTSYDSDNLTADRQSPLWLSTKQPLVTVNASGANTMTDSAYVIRGDEAHPIEFNVANQNALPDKTTDCYGDAVLNLTVGGAYNNGIRGERITMHSGSTLYSKTSWTFHNTAQTVVIDGATLNLNDQSKYVNSLVLTNGAVVTRGNNTRAGFGKDPAWYVAGEGVSACTSSVSIVAGSKGASGTKRTFTIDVADTVAGAASDFVMFGDIAHDGGYPNGVFLKSGAGTMEMHGTLLVSNNAVRVTAGTLLLGKTGAVAASVPFSLEGGTLALAAGTTNEVAAVNVTADSALSVGAGAALTLTNVTVAEGKTFAVEYAGNIDKKGVRVNAALDSAMLSRITLNGKRAHQSSDGYLCRGGLTIIVR